MTPQPFHLKIRKSVGLSVGLQFLAAKHAYNIIAFLYFEKSYTICFRYQRRDGTDINNSI